MRIHRNFGFVALLLAGILWCLPLVPNGSGTISLTGSHASDGVE